MPLDLNKPPSSPAIGIDLGTTFCCLAVYQDGEVTVIRNNLGKNTTPSYVAFVNNRLVVGEVAKDKAHEQPQNTIFDVKRLIGRKFTDEHIQNDIKLWPFDVVEDETDGQLKVRADGRTHLPQDISKELLAYLKTTAEERLGCPITQAVVTVPAYFNSLQRQLTIQACSNAGLKILQLMTEPTAAAVAYNLHRGDDTLRNALIYDLGGGTFDVAVLSMTRNFIRIKSVSGDTRLGGEDFDRLLVDYCIQQFEKTHGKSLAEGKDSENPAVKFKVSKRLRRIKKECEKQKCFLSQAKFVDITVDAVFGELDLAIRVPRVVFEGLIQDYLDRSIKVMEKAILDSGLTKDDIEDVVLIGGSSRIPRVEQMLGEYFQKPLYKAINADEAVAAGAAIQAYYAQLGDLTGIAIEQPGKKASRASEYSPISTPYDISTPLSEDHSETCSPSSQSMWSSTRSVGSIVVNLKGSDSPRRHSKEFIRSLSQASFLEPKTGPTINIGVYIDEDQVRVVDISQGKFTPQSKPIIEPSQFPPILAIKDKLYIGKEAEKYSKGENYYRVLDLVTKQTNKICQLTDSRHADCGILFEEELIGAFFRDLIRRVRKAKGAEIGTVVLALPFVTTSAQRERLKIAAILAKIPNTRLFSTPILTTVAYASLRKNFQMAQNFESITFLVVQYGRRFLSATLVVYSPELLKVKNYYSSYTLPEEEHQQFLNDHEKLFEAKHLEERESNKLLELHRVILEKACTPSEKSLVDFGCLISTHGSEPVEKTVNGFLKKTIYTFDENSGPLAGASILSSKSFSLGETALFDSVPGILECSVKIDNKTQTVFNERNESIIPYPGEPIFDQEITLGADRCRGAVISLREVLPDGISEICTYRLSTSAAPSTNNNNNNNNNNNLLPVPVVCNVDDDGIFHLTMDEHELEDVEFFRTDKLNSDLSRIINRVQSFNAFYKSVDRSSGWSQQMNNFKGTISKSKGRKLFASLNLGSP